METEGFTFIFLQIYVCLHWHLKYAGAILLNSIHRIASAIQIVAAVQAKTYQ